jgi:hypothetical protein
LAQASPVALPPFAAGAWADRVPSLTAEASQEVAAKLAAMEESAKVAVRVRPLLPCELRQDPELCIKTHDRQGLLTVTKDVDEGRSMMLSPARLRAFSAADKGTETLAFDHVWGSTSTQDDVFAQVQPLVDCALNGYNSTVFAYMKANDIVLDGGK